MPERAENVIDIWRQRIFAVAPSTQEPCNSVWNTRNPIPFGSELNEMVFDRFTMSAGWRGPMVTRIAGQGTLSRSHTVSNPADGHPSQTLPDGATNRTGWKAG